MIVSAYPPLAIHDISTREGTFRVIGDGMVARAFIDHSSTPPNSVIFASGVSNSLCKDESEYLREHAAIQHALELNPDARWFIYFGTCSLFDPDQESSMYVRRKTEFEAMIQAHKNGLVVRLPQIAGRTRSKTFCRWLFEAVKSGSDFTLFANASRNVIDIDDVVRILHYFLRRSIGGPNTINIANPHSYPVQYYLRIFESILKKQAKCHVIARGARYEIATPVVDEAAVSLGIDFSEGYVESTLRKYFMPSA